MASSSSASQNPEDSALPHSSSASVGSYDVFISHRGPDIKKTFASHLYRSLLSHGLRVFLDQPELQIGDNFDSQIKHAIETASVNVAIFSRGYADSVWCLDELLLMLESGACILPVFYHVKPSDLRFRKGVYGHALQKLGKKTSLDPQTGEKRPRYDSTRIETWRNALSLVADISGFDLDDLNGDEAELLDNVVKAVLKIKRARKPSLLVAKFSTGLDVKVKDFEDKILLRQHQSGKPRVVGIVGLGGIGKTTLAKEIFNRKCSVFSRSCFLSDVRETAGRSSLHFLQSRLLKGLINLDIQVDSDTDGFKKHLPSVYGDDAIVILDDVDNVDQLNALLPVQNYLSSNSLILITSRDKDVLILSGVEESSIYELSGLDLQHSRELFCSYAFSQPHPVEGFEDAVDEFIRVCNGLPLALKVFGASLYGKTRSDWEDELNQLINTQPHEIGTTVLSLAKHPSGLDGKVKEFEDTVLLQQQSQKLQVVGIVGVDGIGKTTLAKELFERKKSSFPESCILYDVRMSSLNSLLTKLLKGLTQKDSQVESVDDGIYLLKEHVSKHVSSSPAFVILDNVGHPDQLHDLFSVLTFLPAGSIILITSSDKGVLERSGVQESSIYELRGLNMQDSQHLLCSHAFGQPNPLPGFEDFVDKFVTACNGLPLTLKMFGALLRGKSDRPYWQEQLDKLQQSPNDIKRKLEIIYDSLSEEEQHIFLHIACSCIGEKRNLAVRLWDGSCSGALLRFEDLEKRCLVEMDSEDCLIMNGHLRDLGRSIADKKGLLRPPWLPKENKSHLLQESSNEQVLAELRRKIDDLSQQSSNELVGAELRRKIRLPTENNSHLLQESSNEQVVAELRRKIDGLSQQSSGIREVREFMILIVIMMIILLIMILAMMIWSMGLGR